MKPSFSWSSGRHRGVATTLLAGCLAVSVVGCREKLMPPAVIDPGRPDAARDTRPPPRLDSSPTPEPDMAGPAPDAPVNEAGDAPPTPDVPPAEVASDRPPIVDMRPPDLGPAPGNCGLARPDLAMVTGAFSLVIATDGTIYFAHSMGNDGYIGRLRPSGPAAMALSPRLVRIPNGSRLFGMAMDRSRNTIYLASASGRAIHAINVGANPPAVRDLVIGLPAPNDLAWHTDGHLYYSEQSDRRIYRLTPTGVRSQVTTTPLGDAASPMSPAGLAFGPGGALYVGSSQPGPITRLTIMGGVEQSRERFGTYNGVANSLAFDSSGRLYVAAYAPATAGESQVIRLDGAGNNPTMVLSGSQLASVAFGQGMLDCRDLYVTSRPAAMLRIGVDIPGMP